MRIRHPLAAVAVCLAASAASFASPKPSPLAAATTRPATSRPATIDAGDAAAISAAVGKPATVTGTVDKAAWSRSGKVMRISFKDADASHFEAVVFAKTKDALDKKFNGDAAATLTGAKVRVTGNVSTYAPSGSDEKHPQIVIQDVKQIEVEK